MSDELSINFVWIPKEKISSGRIPLPNTSEAPFIENIKKWKALNPNSKVNLYIQQSMIKENGMKEDFFDAESLTNLRLLLGSSIDIEIMDSNFYQESMDKVYDGVQDCLDCNNYRGCLVKPNEVLKKDFFSCYGSTNKHFFKLYQRADFARLLVIERELRTKGSHFAIYVDADISLKTGIEDICQNTDQDVLLWYIPNIPKTGYFIENQMMGFKSTALSDLDRVITTTAHVISNQQNGYSALSTYSEEVDKEFLKIYASEPPPARIASIKDEIDRTSLQEVVEPRQLIQISTIPDLNQWLNKQPESAKKPHTQIDEHKIASTKDGNKASAKQCTDPSQNNILLNDKVDPKIQIELKCKLNKIKKPDSSGPNNGSCNIM